MFTRGFGLVTFKFHLSCTVSKYNAAVDLRSTMNIRSIIYTFRTSVIIQNFDTDEVVC